MGADEDRTGDGDAERDGWLAKRRRKKRDRAEQKRAERENRTAAKRDDQYRKNLEKQRSLSEQGRAPSARMRRAITQIRREGYKVTVIYAVVDAAFAALVVNLLIQVLKPEQLPPTVPWPRVAFDAIVQYTGGPPAPLQTSIVVGLVAGLLVFVVEFVARTRRPFVEQFEGANPDVQEGLRTARDTVRAGKDSRMALALYEDVLARLQRTSSIGLVNLKRVFLTVLVISVVSVASIQVAVVDLDIRDFDGGDAGDDLDDQTRDYEGLEDANDVLGDPEDVSAGEESLNTTLSTQGGGDDGSGSSAAAYSSTGFSGTTDVEGQEAGFAESEQLEDAELIREYNLRIREEDDNNS